MKNKIKEKLFEIIFGVETKAGRIFDIALLWAIVLSVLTVILESVSIIRHSYGELLHIIEWFFTIVFTLEFLLRLYCTPIPSQYAKSFLGIIDFLAILPSYIAFFLTGSQSFLILRGLRLLRIFRILKLSRFIKELNALAAIVKSIKLRVFVFLGSVLTLVLIIGTAMYLIEGEKNGFTSIPRSMYWAIVTMTTVGYGDITPKTILGQILSSLVMLCGYGIIVVPAGIFSAEMAVKSVKQPDIKICKACQKETYLVDAVYCPYCGSIF